MSCWFTGGSAQLYYLSQILPKNLTNEAIPSVIVVDSAPGGDDLKSAFHVFGTTIPNPIIRYIVMSIILGSHILVFLLGRVPWRFHDIVRNAYRKTDLLPWINKGGIKTPYLYIYSKVDKSVPYAHIQAHTERAEKEGQNITRLIYEDTAHVSHMRSDPPHYWEAIQILWKKALIPFS
jgi:pimeloyl-ACP methyl ester carboxylesterase